MESLLLENDLLRVKVLPQGAKVLSLYDRAASLEWLWQNPDNPPHRYRSDCFDDEWFGGMDELFPCDEPELHRGPAYADHGFLWSSAWTVMDSDGQCATLTLQKHGFSILKRLELFGRSLRMHLIIRNCGETAQPFLYRLHPAFELSDDLRILMDAGETVPDNAFCNPPCTAQSFAWPVQPVAGGGMDLSRDVGRLPGQLAFCFIRVGSGGFTLARPSLRRRLRVQFHGGRLPVVTMFLTNGGYRNWRTLALEPCTGMHASLTRAEQSGEASILNPGDCFQSEFILTSSETEE